MPGPKMHIYLKKEHGHAQHYFTCHSPAMAGRCKEGTEGNGHGRHNQTHLLMAVGNPKGGARLTVDPNEVK